MEKYDSDPYFQQTVVTLGEGAGGFPVAGVQHDQVWGDIWELASTTQPNGVGCPLSFPHVFTTSPS